MCQVRCVRLRYLCLRRFGLSLYGLDVGYCRWDCSCFYETFPQTWVHFVLDWFMYRASSVFSWVVFMTVYTFDVMVFGFPWTLASYMLCRTLYASWVISAVNFRVSKLLEAHALEDFALGVRCFELYYCVQ
jgi:hypothetical protein